VIGTRPTIARWRGAIVATVLALTLLACGLFVLANAGNWLVVEDPLQSAPAAVVFGGTTPYRAIEAARIYHAGWVPQVWVTQAAPSGEELALARLGIDRTPEYVLDQQVLTNLGVPPDAIRLLKGANRNTADEVGMIARELQASGGDRIILVTSSYHTRRVRALWRATASDRQMAILRHTPDDPFNPAAWWRSTGDALSVAREWFGLLNARFGFPMASGHRQRSEAPGQSGAGTTSR
jgi:uncharacterized SAM-binding protein YcdF (DUF218 family)